jgi:hypothetical protein
MPNIRSRSALGQLGVASDIVGILKSVRILGVYQGPTAD